MGARSYHSLDDDEDLASFFKQELDVVVFAVSIVSFGETLARIAAPLAEFSPRAMLVDVLSVKEHARSAMLDAAPETASVLCSHPMFGPDSGKHSWQNLPFVYECVRIRHDYEKKTARAPCTKCALSWFLSFVFSRDGQINKRLSLSLLGRRKKERKKEKTPSTPLLLLLLRARENTHQRSHARANKARLFLLVSLFSFSPELRRRERSSPLVSRPRPRRGRHMRALPLHLRVRGLQDGGDVVQAARRLRGQLQRPMAGIDSRFVFETRISVSFPLSDLATMESVLESHGPRAYV